MSNQTHLTGTNGYDYMTGREVWKLYKNERIPELEKTLKNHYLKLCFIYYFIGVINGALLATLLVKLVFK